MVGEPTLADAIEGGVGAVTYELAKAHLHGVRLVQESTIEKAIAGLAIKEHLVVEGAGATGVASLLQGYKPLDPCVIVLSGGNINPSTLSEILARQ